MTNMKINDVFLFGIRIVMRLYFIIIIYIYINNKIQLILYLNINIHIRSAEVMTNTPARNRARETLVAIRHLHLASW